MLHILCRSPWQCDVNGLLRMLRAGDDLLLIQDGVLAAVDGSLFIEMFMNAHITVSVLKNDIEARGLSKQILAKVDIVSYTDFVNLAVKQPSQMSWS